MAYDKDRVVEQTIEDPNELRDFLNQWPVVWVDVVGLGSEQTMRSLSQIFHIHPLALEDIVHTNQRAKVDPYDENLFIVMRIAGDRRIMGRHTNGLLPRVLGWGATALMAVAAIVYVVMTVS